MPRTWSILPTPALGEREGQLAGISCVSTSFCIAAGNSTLPDFNGQEALLEQWTDGVWSELPAIPLALPDPVPDVSLRGSSLDSVSCASANYCVAVGAASVDGPSPELGPVTVRDTWNGVAWESETGVPANKNALTGVSCASASFCAAVGTHSNQGSPSPVKSIWNGTSWEGGREGTLGSLNAVSCASPTFCVAVGYQIGKHSVFESLIESWNGATWAIIPGPQRASGGNGLESVSCASPTRCVAVGGSVAAGPLVEAWNGEVWSIVPTPGAEGDHAKAVSCVSGDVCELVGSETSASGAEEALVATLDGEQWSFVPSADVPTGTSRLSGVSCISDGLCAAVGRDQASGEGPIGTLIEYGDI
jgi:hypothetical protein